ncbi:unnamed protein product [Ilex paraguariensis]|uniref:F-box domain-containing protein n=1 Tax=Ilex paraguariensis TaxID=185542 RepID=A0ABC8TNB5_9AQUA
MDDKGGGRNVSNSFLSSNWADLTHECLINILLRLSLEDRWRTAILVCKPWLHAIKDPVLNSVFDLETYFDPDAESPTWWTWEFEQKIDAMLRSVVVWSDGCLVELRVRHCSDRSLSLVAERCPNLQILSIKSCPNVSDECMDEMASGCPKLEELNISYCYGISHESLAVIGRHCPNLKILKRNLMNWWNPSYHEGIVPNEYLNAYPQDGDSEAAAIGKFMPHLLNLELRFSKLTGKGLALISEGCPNLKYVDLSGCTNVTSSDVANASSNLSGLATIKHPSFYLPRLFFHPDRYGR